MSNGFDKIKGWFRRSAESVEETAEGGNPVATPPPGATSTDMGDIDRETSTNAQVEGAAGQPWNSSS
jgi:hypothetical protein